MKRWMIGFLIVFLIGSVPFTHAQSPQGMQLCVFTSGPLTLPKSFLQSGAPDTPITIPVAFFVIKHPKGNVLFDTGNNDRVLAEPGYWGPFARILGTPNPDLAIDVQLRKIGLTPDDVKYVILGHMHLDHVGNVGKFPNSTIVAQRDEIRNAFWPAPGSATGYIMSDFAMLRSGIGSPMANRFKMIELEGDLDLFRDGSLYIRRSVSHTPGSQMLVVRLPKTGTVILTGDVANFRETVEKNLLPSIALAYRPSGFFEAYEWIREMQAREGADFMTSHDPDAFKTLRHAPNCYE